MLTRITYGNDFSIKVPVVKAQYETSGQVWVDFDIVQCKDVRVSLICTKHQTVIPLEWRIEDGTNNVIIADIQGKWLHSGAIYGVEIVGLDTEDRAWRYYNNSVFSVINTTAGSYMNENLMEDPLIINAQVSLAVNTIMGPQGPQGSQGATGEKGADGTMSFSDLTPEQKESLKGDQGPQGSKGDTGAQGPQGEKGADGTMSFEDLTPEQKESLKGDQGPQGSQGPAGEQGADGAPGPQGSKGDTGAQGPQGEKGADGTMSFEDLTPEQKESLKGDQGSQGSKGDTGAQGPAGEQGADGAPGTQGPQGTQGPAGTTDYDELENKPTFKTINNESILGEGNIEIEGGGDTVEPAKIIVTDEEVQDPDPDAVYIVQKPIELKTINGNSIVGTGDVEIEADTTEIETEISGIQSNISGMQTQISGHQTAIQNQATEISGMQTQISGHQTAIQNQATEISGMQTVLVGHQTALENQSGGGPDYHIYVRWSLTSDGIFYFGIELLDSDYHYVKRYTNGFTGGGFNQMLHDLPNYGLGLIMSINGVESNYFNFEYSTITRYGFKATLPYTTNNVTMDYGSRITFDICKYNGSYNDTTYVYDHFDIQIPLDKNTLVTSTTSGLSIEIVNSMPAQPEQNVIYIVI